jgi:preprotein translocase subunit SecE
LSNSSLKYNPLQWVENSREFLNEVQVEFKKIAWPTQKETIAGTVSVIAVVGIIAVALAGVDWLLSLLMSQVLPSA